MDIVNEKIGIKDILSGFAELVFAKKEDTKKDNEKELEERLNEIYKVEQEIGATKRIEVFEKNIEKHEVEKTKGRKTLVKEVKTKQNTIQEQQAKINKENEQIENEEIIEQK